MNLPDFVPLTSLSEFYQIPVEIIVMVILISGYLTVRIGQKKHSLPKLDSLDVVFILAFTGITWFIRFALSLFWIGAFVITYLTDPATLQELGDVAVGYIFGLIVFIWLSSGIDIRAIKHKQLLDKKPPKQHKYQIINRWDDWFEKHRFKILIAISVFFAGFLSIGFFSHGIEHIGLALFYLIMLLFAVVPSISLLFILINKLLS